MRQRRWFPIYLGLLAAACLPPVRTAGESKNTEPHTGAIAGSKLGSGTTAPSAGAAPGTGDGQKRLDLTEFRPLLAGSELGSVRALLQEDEVEKGAQEFARILDAKLADEKLKPVDVARWSYALGVLQRESGLKAEGIASFERAAKVKWTLQGDAKLEAAELSLDEGHAEQALELIEGAGTRRSSVRGLRLRARVLDAQKVESSSAWAAVAAESESAPDRLAHAEAHLGAIEATLGKEKLDTVALAIAFDEAVRAATGYPEDDPLSKRSEAVIARIKKLSPNAMRQTEAATRLDDLQGLVERRAYEEAFAVAAELELPARPTFSKERCRRDFWLSKALAGQRKWGEAAEKIASAAEHCTEDPKLHAWLLFNAGKFNAADGRHTPAIRFYADLERLYPENSLADDSRLRMAKSYKRQGVMARYIDLLSSLPDVYPQGDMTMEGVLLLALHRMERKDWSGASQVLTRAASIVRPRDSARGHEHAGTERYFLARCMQELGQEEEALKEFEAIVVEVPLSYYMLHAFSRLLEADPKRARAALAKGVALAKEKPFSFPHRPEYDSSEFKRGMELLRVGELERGQAVISKLGLGEGADASLLWGIALLYDRAGDAHQSHGIARGRLTDWFAHYPAGDWQGAWEIGFPRPYHSIVTRESEATGVPEWLIYGVMREESTFRPRVVSHANAYGLMQVIIPTARGIGKKAGLPYSASALERPSVNIAIGSRVLKELGRRFRENPWLAIPGYNAGPGRPARWLRERPNVDFDIWVEMIPFRETRRYMKRVLASRAAYAYVYHREDAQTALVLPKRLTFPRP